MSTITFLSSLARHIDDQGLGDTSLSVAEWQSLFWQAPITAAERARFLNIMSGHLEGDATTTFSGREVANAAQEAVRGLNTTSVTPAFRVGKVFDPGAPAHAAYELLIGDIVIGYIVDRSNAGYQTPQVLLHGPVTPKHDGRLVNLGMTASTADELAQMLAGRNAIDYLAAIAKIERTDRALAQSMGADTTNLDAMTRIVDIAVRNQRKDVDQNFLKAATNARANFHAQKQELLITETIPTLAGNSAIRPDKKNEFCLVVEVGPDGSAPTRGNAYDAAITNALAKASAALDEEKFGDVATAALAASAYFSKAAVEAREGGQDAIDAMEHKHPVATIRLQADENMPGVYTMTGAAWPMLMPGHEELSASSIANSLRELAENADELARQSENLAPVIELHLARIEAAAGANSDISSIISGIRSIMTNDAVGLSEMRRDGTTGRLLPPSTSITKITQNVMRTLHGAREFLANTPGAPTAFSNAAGSISSAFGGLESLARSAETRAADLQRVIASLSVGETRNIVGQSEFNQTLDDKVRVSLAALLTSTLAGRVIIPSPDELLQSTFRGAPKMTFVQVVRTSDPSIVSVRVQDEYGNIGRAQSLPIGNLAERLSPSIASAIKDAMATTSQAPGTYMDVAVAHLNIPDHEGQGANILQVHAGIPKIVHLLNEELKADTGRTEDLIYVHTEKDGGLSTGLTPEGVEAMRLGARFRASLYDGVTTRTFERSFKDELRHSAAIGQGLLAGNGVANLIKGFPGFNLVEDFAKAVARHAEPHDVYVDGSVAETAKKLLVRIAENGDGNYLSERLNAARKSSMGPLVEPLLALIEECDRRGVEACHTVARDLRRQATGNNLIENTSMVTASFGAEPLNPIQHGLTKADMIRSGATIKPMVFEASPNGLFDAGRNQNPPEDGYVLKIAKPLVIALSQTEMSSVKAIAEALHEKGDITGDAARFAHDRLDQMTALEIIRKELLGPSTTDDGIVLVDRASGWIIAIPRERDQVVSTTRSAAASFTLGPQIMPVPPGELWVKGEDGALRPYNGSIDPRESRVIRGGGQDGHATTGSVVRITNEPVPTSGTGEKRNDSALESAERIRMAIDDILTSQGNLTAAAAIRQLGAIHLDANTPGRPPATTLVDTMIKLSGSGVARQAMGKVGVGVLIVDPSPKERHGLAGMSGEGLLTPTFRGLASLVPARTAEQKRDVVQGILDGEERFLDRTLYLAIQTTGDSGVAQRGATDQPVQGVDNIEVVVHCRKGALLLVDESPCNKRMRDFAEHAAQYGVISETQLDSIKSSKASNRDVYTAIEKGLRGQLAKPSMKGFARNGGVDVIETLESTGVRRVEWTRPYASQLVTLVEFKNLKDVVIEQRGKEKVDLLPKEAQEAITNLFRDRIGKRGATFASSERDVRKAFESGAIFARDIHPLIKELCARVMYGDHELPVLFHGSKSGIAGDVFNKNNGNVAHGNNDLSAMYMTADVGEAAVYAAGGAAGTASYLYAFVPGIKAWERLIVKNADGSLSSESVMKLTPIELGDIISRLVGEDAGKLNVRGHKSIADVVNDLAGKKIDVQIELLRLISSKGIEGNTKLAMLLRDTCGIGGVITKGDKELDFPPIVAEFPSTRICPKVTLEAKKMNGSTELRVTNTEHGENPMFRGSFSERRPADSLIIPTMEYVVRQLAQSPEGVSIRSASNLQAPSHTRRNGEHTEITVDLTRIMSDGHARKIATIAAIQGIGAGGLAYRISDQTSGQLAAILRNAIVEKDGSLSGRSPVASETLISLLENDSGALKQLNAAIMRETGLRTPLTRMELSSALAGHCALVPGHEMQASDFRYGTAKDPFVATPILDGPLNMLTNNPVNQLAQALGENMNPRSLAFMHSEQSAMNVAAELMYVRDGIAGINATLGAAPAVSPAQLRNLAQNEDAFKQIANGSFEPAQVSYAQKDDGFTVIISGIAHDYDDQYNARAQPVAMQFDAVQPHHLSALVGDTKLYEIIMAGAGAEGPRADNAGGQLVMRTLSINNAQMETIWTSPGIPASMLLGCDPAASSRLAALGSTPVRIGTENGTRAPAAGQGLVLSPSDIAPPASSATIGASIVKQLAEDLQAKAKTLNEWNNLNHLVAASGVRQGLDDPRLIRTALALLPDGFDRDHAIYEATKAAAIAGYIKHCEYLGSSDHDLTALTADNQLVQHFRANPEQAENFLKEVGAVQRGQIAERGPETTSEVLGLWTVSEKARTAVNEALRANQGSAADALRAYTDGVPVDHHSASEAGGKVAKRHMEDHAPGAPSR